MPTRLRAGSDGDPSFGCAGGNPVLEIPPPRSHRTAKHVAGQTWAKQPDRDVRTSTSPTRSRARASVAMRGAGRASRAVRRARAKPAARSKGTLVTRHRNTHTFVWLSMDRWCWCLTAALLLRRAGYVGWGVSLSIIGFNCSKNGMRSTFKGNNFCPLNPPDADRLVHTSHTPTSSAGDRRHVPCARAEVALVLVLPTAITYVGFRKPHLDATERPRMNARPRCIFELCVLQ